MIKLPTELSTIVIDKVYNVTGLYSKLYQIIPRQCLLCKSKVYGKNICSYCNDSLPRLSKKCQYCGWPVLSDLTHCQLCVSFNDIELQAITIMFPYMHPIDKMLQQFKYNNNLVLGRLLAELFIQCITSFDYLGEPKPEAIIPVPLHQSKLRTRGFNQTVEICKYISKHTGIYCDTSLITKFKKSNSQMGNNKENRKNNIKDSFCFNYKPKYKSVVIFDDVVTTGSTVKEIIHLLKQANIRTISLWAIARVC